MALSQKLKDALADKFRDTDLYDPSEDPEQETADFIPKAMSGDNCAGHYSEGGQVNYCGGGCAGMSNGGMIADSDFPSMKEIMRMEAGQDGYTGGIHNMNNGGPILGNIGQPVFSFDSPSSSSLDDPFSVATSTEQNANVPPPVESFDPDDVDIHSGSTVKSAINSVPSNPDTDAQHGTHPTETLQSLPIPQAAKAVEPSEQPAQKSGGLSGDQFDELIGALKKGTGMGGAAMQGLAGLADSIQSGVARAGPGQFQKNIMQDQEERRQNLINALKSKYETQYRGQELGQGQQRIDLEAQHNALDAKFKQATIDNDKATLELENKKLHQQIANENRQRQLGSAQITREAASKSAELGQSSRGWFSHVLGIDSPEAIAAQKVLQGQMQSQPDMVHLKIPDGTTHWVPKENVNKVMAKYRGTQVIP